MNNNQLEELKLNIKNELKSVIEAELLTELDDRLKLQNNEIDNELIRVRQALQSDGGELKDDQVGNILNEHMKDITKETPPQISASGGLEGSKKHFRDLNNHELHQIKKMHEKDHSIKPRTILDESLGDIMNKLVNFLTFSFDGYTKAYYAAEIMEDVYDNEKSMYQSIKVHLIAIILFMREDQNILYIGILLVFLSMIIYLVNITTS
tara:strand:- start:344 stop:967 length:624 start_codon:yes stop_codon:yes gene_type:complete